MPCATRAEWSGQARLQPVLHGFLLFWDHYFSDFSIGCNNGKMMTMTKITVQLQFGGEPCILLQITCTTTYQVITRVKQSIWSHKQATCSGKNFEEIIFVVDINPRKKWNLLSSKISHYTVIICQSRLSIAQLSSSFKYLVMHTFMYATPTLIM